MTPEEKIAADTAKAEEKKAADAKAAEEAEGGDTDDSEDEGEGSSDSDNQDLKTQLEQEKAARKVAEDKIAETKLKAQEAARRRAEKRKNKAGADESGEEGSEGEEDEADEADRPLTQRAFDQRLAEERELTEKRLNLDQATAYAKELGRTPEEQELILLTFQNRSFPSHLSLREKIEEAHLLANKKKILGEHGAALRALASKDGVNRDAASAHHDPLPGKEPAMPAADKAAIVAAGFSFNATTRQYEKKLPTGAKIVRDPKTKATRYIPKGGK